MRECGGNQLNYLKRSGIIEKRGGDTKILKKKGGKLGQGVCTLLGVNRGGDWNPLTNYGLQMSYFLKLCGEINGI